MASLSTNIFANYVGRTWSALLGILLIPIYIKFIGIEAYGLVGFFAAISSVIGILDLGIGGTMTRELARRSVDNESFGSQRDLVRTLELIYWGIAIIAGLIIFILAQIIADNWIQSQNLNSEYIASAVQLMGFSIAFQFPIALYQGGLMGLQKQVLVNKILVLIGTLRGGGAVIVLWLISPTIHSFFAWQIVINLIGSIIFIIAIWLNLPKSKDSPKFKKEIIFEIWSYAAATSSNAIIGVILSQLDKIILSKILPLNIFAYYSIAATVASSIWMIIVPFNNAVFPYLVQLNEMKESKRLRVIFHLYSQSLSLILIPTCAIIIFFSKEIIFLWMHDTSVSENTHLIVSLLVFGTMLNGMVSLPALSATAMGWPMLMTYTNILQSILLIPLIVYLTNLLAGVGASIAWIILNSTYILFMAPIFFKRFMREEQSSWYWNDIIIPASVAFSICAISRVFSPEFSSSLISILWILVTGCISLILTGLSLEKIRGLFGAKIKDFYNSYYDKKSI